MAVPTLVPKTLREWAFFVGAVFVATVIANTLLNRLPVGVAGPLTSASRGF